MLVCGTHSFLGTNQLLFGNNRLFAISLNINTEKLLFCSVFRLAYDDLFGGFCEINLLLIREGYLLILTGIAVTHYRRYEVSNILYIIFFITGVFFSKIFDFLLPPFPFFGASIFAGSLTFRSCFCSVFAANSPVWGYMASFTMKYRSFCHFGLLFSSRLGIETPWLVVLIASKKALFIQVFDGDCFT